MLSKYRMFLNDIDYTAVFLDVKTSGRFLAPGISALEYWQASSLLPLRP